MIAPDSLNSTVVGQSATSLANDATAIGQAATANYEGSTAIGQGVSTVRANQVAIGSEDNTYTFSGVTSDASRAARVGPTQVLTTDAAGNIAGDGGALNARLDGFDSDIEENREGVAVSLAIQSPDFVSGETLSLIHI